MRGGVEFQAIYIPINQGLGNALELVIARCKYEIVARMDSDDIALPNRFETQLCFFEEFPELAIVGGDITEFIGTQHNIVGKRIVPTSDSMIKEYMKRRCAFNHMTVMYKKSAVLRAGNYKDLFWNEDYYLWIRMIESGCQMMNTGTVLVNVRVDCNTYKRRGGRKYFRSEWYLQKYMLSHKLIGVPTYMVNMAKRVVVQLLASNSVRGWIYRTFTRKSV